VLDAEPVERPAHLGEPILVHRLARLGREEVVAATVGIEASRQAMGAKHLQQGGVTGPKLGPDPLPLETFVSYIRTTNRAMPPYREPVLSNGDVADIHAYLASVPKPADYKTILLLNQ
jgi:hypothetical protein